MNPTPTPLGRHSGLEGEKIGAGNTFPKFHGQKAHELLACAAGIVRE